MPMLDSMHILTWKVCFGFD